MKALPQSDAFFFQTENLSYEVKETPSGKEYFVEGYSSTHDLDLVKDIVTTKGMDNLFGQFDSRNMKLDFEHESLRGKDQLESQLNITKTPLGKAVGTRRDATGVFNKWQLNPSWKKFDEKGNITKTFREVWKEIKDGYLDAFSIAYIPTRTAKHTTKDGTEARLLDEMTLINVALTGNPCNPEAKMTTVFAKSLEFLRESEEKKTGDNMTEKEIKEKVDEAPEESEAPEATEAPENPAASEVSEAKKKIKQHGEEEEDEEDEEDETKKKSESESNPELIEVKSLNAELKSKIESLETKYAEMDTKHAELKAKMEKAQHKALNQSQVAAEIKDKASMKVEGLSPLQNL